MKECITVDHGQNPIAHVVWLHGLGADGHDFAGVVSELRLPESLPLRFLFPHAPVRPITINGGMPMRGWYDIITLDPNKLVEDEASIVSGAQALFEFVSSKALAEKPLVLIGFSQGGALALFTGIMHKIPQLKGVLGLSTYLPLASLVIEKAKVDHSLPVAMMYGEYDEIVPVDLGHRSRQALVKLGYHVDWHTYPMTHSVCPQELHDIGQWITKLF